MFLYELGDDQSWISLKRNKSQKGRPKPSLVLHIGCLHFMFNATFNNISVILWQFVLLVEETRVPGENHNLSGDRH